MLLFVFAGSAGKRKLSGFGFRLGNGGGVKLWTFTGKLGGGCLGGFECGGAIPLTEDEEVGDGSKSEVAEFNELAVPEP